ncbi:secretion/DNA translocation related TadE-like protein [Nesterenkonia lacusekhoensis]|uniref:Secretion/DNA translocation related TadE-like protein n=2 Tax=Nesterenkonia lacusekhoensis TaxID=150832 RepID=A0ABS4T4T4_9MICC|nr:Rv3654c family TadE-like protein [Nesterenkonia lacusekhoensis]MBP2319465.1 secretion/DNA translocation related TadE-like protein [Nesterenkonia lacusekhoensis]
MRARETDTVPARGDTERGASERGSGTVLVLGMIAVLVLLLGLVHLLSASATAAAQAARAADLAALAGADAARGLTSEDPCSVAEEVATANGAQLSSCTVGGDFGTEITVETTRDLLEVSPLNPSWLPLPQMPANGVSRAGPPEASE